MTFQAEKPGSLKKDAPPQESVANPHFAEPTQFIPPYLLPNSSSGIVNTDAIYNLFQNYADTPFSGNTGLSKNEGTGPILQQHQNPIQANFATESQPKDERNIEKVTNPKTKKTVYKYTENGKETWLDEAQINFMNGPGQDIMKTGADNGFSSFGSLFMMAQSSIESGWGKGNWMNETHNLFSVMGGSNPKHKNSHGTLKTYADNQAATDDYIKLLGQRWPGATNGDTALFRQDSFSPDDANKSFNQFNYYPTDKERHGGKYAYNADKNSDYGRDIMKRMSYISGPMLTLQEQRLAQETDPEKRSQLEKQIAELRATRNDLKTQLRPKTK